MESDLSYHQSLTELSVAAMGDSLDRSNPFACKQCGSYLAFAYEWTERLPEYDYCREVSFWCPNCTYLWQEYCSIRACAQLDDEFDLAELEMGIELSALAGDNLLEDIEQFLAETDRFSAEAEPFIDALNRGQILPVDF
ncbi:MAG TPA: hypothetical protein VMR75_02015 [Candidatus Saccharimonadales bacterium]|nr:hypothetical protein [Candidatus Saccharimonadales bacterium]